MTDSLDFRVVMSGLIKPLMLVVAMLFAMVPAMAQDDIYLKQAPVKGTGSVNGNAVTTQPITSLDESSQSAPAAKIGLGLIMRSGITNNSMLDNLNFSNVERQITLGFSQFVGVRLEFYGGQAVSIEGGFQQRNYRRVITDSDSTNLRYTETATVNSFSIPIRYQYVFVNTDKVFLSADLGLDVNLAQDGGLTIRANRGNGSFFSPLGDLIVKTELCNTVGLTAGLRVAPRLFLEGNLALVTGMNSINNGLYKLNNGSQYVTYTRATLFTLGLRYQLFSRN